MQEVTKSTVNNELAKLPPLLRALRNPIAIVLVTYILAHTIGVVLLGGLLKYFLLDAPDYAGNNLWTKDGLCGPFQGWQDASIILCRLFYPDGALIFILIPFLFVAAICWLIQCIHARKFLWRVTRHQRRYIIFFFL